MAKRYSIWAGLTAIIKKDLTEELRTRYAINALLMFAVVTLVVVSFSVGASIPDPDLNAALLWIVLFFTSMSGMGRSFIKEEENATAVPLRMATSSDVVFLGKLCVNAIMMLSISVVVLILYIFLMDISTGNLLLLTTVVLCGSLCIAAATTMLAAIVAKSANQSALLPVLSLPVLMPLLMVAINASRSALEGSSFAQTAGMLFSLFSYGVVIVAVSLLLFDSVWSN